MAKPYIYNVNTHTLHIEGFCHLTSGGKFYGTDYKCFENEDEVLAFDGRTVSMCKLCMKKRDKMIKNHKGELK